MASHITQITTYQKTLANGEDVKQGCVREALKAVEGADGWIRAYNGVQLPESGLGFWIFDWESTAHRDAFLADEAHAPVLAALRGVVASSGTEAQDGTGSLQVQFDPPHAPAALGAPVTEIAIGTLRRGVETAVYEALMRRVMEAVGRAKGAQGAGWGKVVGNDEEKNAGSARYVLVVGWESAEAQQQAVAARSAHELHEEVNGLAEYEMKLVQLTQYEKGSAV